MYRCMTVFSFFDCSRGHPEVVGRGAAADNDDSKPRYALLKKCEG